MPPQSRHRSSKRVGACSRRDPTACATGAARRERAKLIVTRIGLPGTVRTDGSPRVSPIEVAVFEGGLFVGMMPSSRKRADVERDPRVCLLTPVTDHKNLGGEGNMFGRLERVVEKELAERILRSHAEDGDFDPESIAGSPMYGLLISSAAWQRVVNDVWTATTWNPVDGLRHRHLSDPMGEMTDA